MKKISLILLDRYYYVGMLLTTVIVLYFNYYAQTMSGLLLSYRAFGQVIYGGFNPSVTTYYPLTFPIWGYGFLMAITTNHTILLMMQLGLAFLSVWVFINILQKYSLLSNQALRMFKILIIIAVPWYSFHTVKWPYSVASSFFILSLSYLYKGIKEKDWLRYIILSSFFFGLLLNFRSDYILMPIGFCFIIFLLQKHSFILIKKITLWFLCIYICLMPWAIWTKKVCGHYLLTSTNGGHVLMNGLGQYPQNRWGLKCDDGCEVIHGIVEQKYGEGACTWDYKSDQLLKKTFTTFVLDYPQEYIQKLYYCFFNMLKKGMYQGEFFMRFSDKYFEKTNKELIVSLYRNPTLSCLPQYIAVFLQRYSYVFGKYLLIISCWLLPFGLIRALYTKNLFYSLIFSSILYQIMLNVFLQYLTGYSSNVLIFMLLLFVYCYNWMQAIRKQLCKMLFY